MTPFSAVNDVSSTREARLQDGCEYNFCGAGGAFLGLSGGIGGILIADGWDAFVVSFYRVASGLLCVLVWIILRPQSRGLTNRQYRRNG